MKLYRLEPIDPSRALHYVEQPFVEVPWCAEHDLPAKYRYEGSRVGCDWPDLNPSMGHKPCRLEDPPRHIRLPREG